MHSQWRVVEFPFKDLGERDLDYLVHGLLLGGGKADVGRWGMGQQTAYVGQQTA